MARPKKVISPVETGLKKVEKSGKLLISSKELKEIRSGKVPKRVEETWGLTVPEARDMVVNGCYEVTDATPIKRPD